MKKIIILLPIIAIAFAFFFTSCDKEKTKEEPNKVVSIDINKLPVYYNGVKMNCTLENFKKPASRSGDAEDVSIAEDEAIYIFDEDAAFYDYCVDRENITMYETTKKLDSIHAKAVELGITELGEEYPIPTAMYNYYTQIFNVASTPSPTRGIVGTLYAEQFCQSKLRDFFPLFHWNFGPSVNKARSYSIIGPVGLNWMCTKTWFGGDKLLLAFAGYQVFKIDALPPKFDKKLCSSFGLF